MIINGEKILNYMRDEFDEDDAFVLIEYKKVSGRPELKYHVKGEPRTVLTVLAEIVERESHNMGISFDQTMDVMTNLHGLGFKGYIEHPEKLEKEWKPID